MPLLDVGHVQTVATDCVVVSSFGWEYWNEDRKRKIRRDPRPDAGDAAEARYSEAEGSEDEGETGAVSASWPSACPTAADSVSTAKKST